MSNENISQKHVFVCRVYILVMELNLIEYVGLQPYTFYV